MIRGHVNLLTISIPWSKLNWLSSQKTPWRRRNHPETPPRQDVGTIVVVHLLDGVQLPYSYAPNMNLMTMPWHKHASRIVGNNYKMPTTTTTTTIIRRMPQDPGENLYGSISRMGFCHKLPTVYICMYEILHIRLEDIHSSPQRPKAVGIVLESLHLQHTTEPQPTTSTTQSSNANAMEDPTHVQKRSQVNHFAIYANALEATPSSVLHASSSSSAASHHRWSERSILQHCDQKDTLVEVLDRSIPRRANSVEAMARLAPQHTYVLSPLDAMAHLQSGTDPALLVSQNRPVLYIHYRHLQGSHGLARRSLSCWIGTLRTISGSQVPITVSSLSTTRRIRVGESAPLVALRRPSDSSGIATITIALVLATLSK